MKARNPVYRALLAYFLWMSRLSGGQRWGVIIGGYLAAQVIPGAMVVYLPLVILTWGGQLVLQPSSCFSTRSDAWCCRVTSASAPP